MASRRIEDLNIVLAEAFLKAKAEYEGEFRATVVFLTCTYRSNEEQNIEYAKGRTTKGAKVTNAKAGQSPHNFNPSFAFDIAFKNRESGKLDWGVKRFMDFAAIIKKIEPLVDWGGDWVKFKDRPHFELRGWRIK